MPESITHLTANDFDKAIQFLNMVFAVHGDIDFPVLLPDLYQPTDEHMRCNYAVKRHGRIRAIVGLFPMTLFIGGAVLKTAGIGGVSVHLNDRGRGYMKRLMDHCLEVMQEESYQLSWLGGQRQRYGHWGYEVCGQRYRFKVTKANIKHCCANAPGIDFELLDREDAAAMKEMVKWHNRRLIHVQRSGEAFYDAISSWKNAPYAAWDDSGRAVGYIVANTAADTVAEIAARDKEAMQRIIAAWVEQSPGDAVEFEAPPLASSLTRFLFQTGESSSILPAGNWRVFDWPAVIEASLRAKNSSSRLPSGAFRLGIQESGVFELSVDGMQAHCRPTDAAPDLQCDAKTAMTLLFGPMPPELAKLSPIDNFMLHAWAPLPLYMPRQDEV